MQHERLNLTTVGRFTATSRAHLLGAAVSSTRTQCALSSRVSRLARTALAVAASSALALALAACGDSKRPAAPTAMPPPEVGVVTVHPTRIANTVELPGRVQATRTAQVRARVEGIVEQRLYQEGTDVKAGAPLFQIDPRTLSANLAVAQAGLARAQADAGKAKQDVERFRPLVAENAISKQEVDAALAKQAQAEADVASARATLDKARLDLGYATVSAPISGRVGRAQITEGALVGKGEATLLTTIEQIDPVYVNFTQSSAEILQLRKAMESGRLKVPQLGEVKVALVQEDGSIYEHPGKLNFADLAVDPGTGEMSLRAAFPNPKRMLFPGMFVRVRIEEGVNERGIAVPQRAVQITPQGAIVMTVAEDGKVAPRTVKTGEMQAGNWVILDGLKPGERVIVDGLQKVRPGAQVQVVEATAGETTPSQPATRPQADKQPTAGARDAAPRK